MTTAFEVNSQQEFDASLLARIGRGDGEAFETFYKRHATGVAQALRSWFQFREDLSDVLQEVFLQVWMRAGSYDAARGPVRTWLLIVARSRALDLLRSQQRFIGEEWAACDTLVEESRVVPVDLLWIGQALDDLPPHHRHTLWLAYYEGFSHSQLARKLECPLGTVKTRIRAGLNLLRQAAGLN